MEIDFHEKITGRYTHFKNNDLYYAFCTAYDTDGNKYVLYRECYGEKLFWIRPYDMFFDTITLENRTVKRFAPTSSKQQSANKKIKELIGLIESQNIVLQNSETKIEYIISQIDQSNDYVFVQPISVFASGYLTEFELARRLGFFSCRINGEIKFFNLKKPIDEHKALHIGSNDINVLKDLLNPCSIDLQIADSGFLKTRFKLVDPQSIEHVSSAPELWKPVRKHTSKSAGSSYFRIRPGSTILTHTRERIRIPDDCAGKIEIKSTFARLSLSITFGDFCNPGYDGFFPLEIKNNGHHTIIIHENETMAQLILIPLQGPILAEYSAKATFKNNKGFDDGTPYSFWRERSIKSLRKNNGTQQIIDLSTRMLGVFNSDNTHDVNEYRNRFNNYFLPFCHKHIHKSKYINNDSGLPDAKKLVMAYIKREKILKSIYSIKWLSGVLTLICALLPLALQLMQNAQGAANLVTMLTFWPCFAIAGVLLLITIILCITAPKVFCTFERIDLEKQFIEAKSD